MCRFTLYKGKLAYVGDVVIKPENALLSQARNACHHPGVLDPYGKRNIIVNGDGFGIAWYCEEESREDGACVFKIHTPAWSDPNILNIGRYVKSPVILGHVRAAANGRNPLEPVVVSFQNCHPFKYGRYTFMHNGGIPSFEKIKRDFCNMMSYKCFSGVLGSTDSEHIFALFLSLLEDRDSSVSAEMIAEKLRETFCSILTLCHKHNIQSACSLNVCVTDGVHVVASRYRNSDAEPPSLYYSCGSNYSPCLGNFRNRRSCRNGGREVIITSSPLNLRGCVVDSPASAQASIESEEVETWRLIPKNHMLVCTGNPDDLSEVLNISVVPVTCGEEGAVHSDSPYKSLSGANPAPPICVSNGSSLDIIAAPGNTFAVDTIDHC